MRLYFTLLIFLSSPGFAYSQNWVQVGLGAYAPGVHEMYWDTINNQLYAGGNFKTQGIDTIKGIAHWNGTKWDSIGGGISSSSKIHTIRFYNGELYAGGNFQQIGNTLTSSIAKWNGVTWDSLRGGLGSPVFALEEFNNTLYVAGMFGYADTTTSRSIATWNGINYQSVGDPTWTLVQVFALEQYSGNIYAAGSFDADDYGSPNILRWNGNSWSGVSTGINGSSSVDPVVTCMTVYNGQLYIGGSFDISANAGNFIMKWDGNTFSDVGGGMNAGVTDLAVFNNELYAVGYFTEAGGVAADKIAKWDGVNWCGLGSSFNGTVYEVEIFNNNLYVGGNFSLIDGSSISGIAMWTGGSYTDTCGNTTSLIRPQSVNDNISVYPNPTDGLFTLEFSVQQKEDAVITVYDYLGQKVHSEKYANCLGKCTRVLDLTGIADGIYFVVAELADGTAVKKIVKH